MMGPRHIACRLKRRDPTESLDTMSAPMIDLARILLVRAGCEVRYTYAFGGGERPQIVLLRA